MADYDANAAAYDNWYSAENDYHLVELTRFFQVLDDVEGLNVLELACGDGRISRMLADRGARSVFATDVSTKMIERAVEKNRDAGGGTLKPALTFQVLDACDADFQLAEPVDRVVGMYLFHYAPTIEALQQMCRLIGRNLKPGGRLVSYTVNPDYDFTHTDPRVEAEFKFSYRMVSPPHIHLVFKDLTVNLWQWSKSAHEEALHAAGLEDIRWDLPCVPDDRPESAAALKWYLDKPSCLVLSARKPR